MQDVFNNIVSRLQGVTVLGPNRIKAQCPSHDDAHPSFYMTLGNHAILIKDFAGCSFNQMCESLQVHPSQLFLDHTDSLARRPHKRIEKEAEAFVLPMRWNWRSQCNQLEVITDCRRVLAEDFLRSIQGTVIDVMPNEDFDFLMEQVSLARSWITLAETVEDFVFDIRSQMRREESTHAHH